MFTRFTPAARAVVLDAVEHARDDGWEVREEHLVAAVLRTPGVRSLLAQVGVLGVTETDPPVLEEIRAARRRGGLSAADAQALAGLGIDVDSIVRRVESALGTGVLDDSQRRGRRGRSRVVFSAGSKLALQAGLHQALDRGDRDLREEHLVLGLLAGRGVVADVFGARGVTTATLLAALDAGGPAQERAS